MNKYQVQTLTGKYLDPFDLRRDDVDIRDIAYVLSGLKRFGGHATRGMDVASHAVAVARAVDGLEDWGYSSRQEAVRAALHHDDHEAYLLGDIPRPVKLSFDARWQGYRDLLEAINRIDARVSEAFEFPHGVLANLVLKRADTVVLACEAWAQMGEPDWARELWPEVVDEDAWPHGVHNLVKTVRTRKEACILYLQTHRYVIAGDPLVTPPFTDRSTICAACGQDKILGDHPKELPLCLKCYKPFEEVVWT